MKAIKNSFLAFLRDEDGLTTVEYAIAGGLVSALLIGAFSDLGEAVQGVITDLGTAISAIVIN